MPALKAELSSDYLELDDYWTLSGGYELPGFASAQKTTNYGELPNLAKVRLRAKEGADPEGYELGTLTFTSEGRTLLVLTLTGMIGDPRITMEEIPKPTKYVPYGTMIANNNKYSWNKIKYTITKGRLPNGLELMDNGEIYGVPKEAGDFEVTVKMTSSGNLQPDSKDFLITVWDNTDSNVDKAEDPGYKLTKRISGIYDTTADGSYLIISEGLFDEYTDLFIDGEKLVKGTDYNAESGSTRITIASQSLPKSVGTHTIGVEFQQEGSRSKVKAGAQNYTVTSNSNSGSSSGSSGGGYGGYIGSGTGGSKAPSVPDNSGATTPPQTPSVPPSGSDTPSGTKPDDGTSGPGLNTSIGKDMIYARGYIVKKGDTLKSLAKKFYGKSSKWKKIYDANKKKIPASKKLKVGMRLQIPAINYTVKKGDTVKSIAKKYFGANSKWKQVYQVNKDVIPASLKLKAGTKLVIPVPVVCRIYAVKKGDTLEKIAKKFYGKASKWEKIYNANKNKISASKKVKAGTSLFIPAMTYKVKKGDKIKDIAKRYYGAKGEWRQIYDANKDVIPASKKLKAGVTLVLPVPVDIG